MERYTRREFLGKVWNIVVGTVLGGFALGADECSDEMPPAVTVPTGGGKCETFWFDNDLKDDRQLKAHEARHRLKCLELERKGKSFLEYYLEDPCREERRAGRPDHPVCRQR